MFWPREYFVDPEYAWLIIFVSVAAELSRSSVDSSSVGQGKSFKAACSRSVKRFWSIVVGQSLWVSSLV